MKSGQTTMREIPTLIATLSVFALGLAALLTSQAAQTAQTAPEPGPCAQITAACKSAGFTPGGLSTGAGLKAHCLEPLMTGKAQPPAARNSLPKVDSQLIAACKTSNPRFGLEPAVPLQPSAQRVQGMAAAVTTAETNGVNAPNPGSNNTAQLKEQQEELKKQQEELRNLQKQMKELQERVADIPKPISYYCKNSTTLASTAGKTWSCGNYLCRGDACLVQCTNPSDCKPPNVCAGPQSGGPGTCVNPSLIGH
jgi:hypothetical protein